MLRSACGERPLPTRPLFLPTSKIARLAVQQQDWQGALQSISRTCNWIRRAARTSGITALFKFPLGNLAAAENGANKLLAMDPLHNIRNGEQLLAVILARRADYTAALAHLRHCLSYVPDGPHAELLRAQIAQLEKH